MQLLTLMNILHNHFIQERTAGTFHIREGTAEPAPFQPLPPYLLAEGQLHRLDASGRYPTLPAGSRTMTMYACYPPAELVALAEDITAWEKAHPTAGLASEALGEYRVSYHAAPGGWQQAFAHRLTPFRRMFAEVTD